jgi:nucleoside-diphosphate-sugar epimerase
VRIAVTGATGFIGSHVVAELDRRGHSAILASRSALQRSPIPTEQRHVPLDIYDPPDDAYQALGQPDVLLHLAWAGLSDYRSLLHIERELPSHYRFLRTMLAGGLSRLVVTGTCLEYGLQSGALHEELEARPTTPYGYAKNALRTQLEYLKRDLPFALTWARIFYVFGVGQASTSLYSQVTAAAERGDPVFNMSGGEQLRDYLPVSTAARYLVSLATNGGDNGIVNVCSGKPVSVYDLVESWIAARGWSITLNRGKVPYPDYEPMEFWGDRRKMDRCLGGSAAW